MNNDNKSKTYVTNLLIGINLFLFALQFIKGNHDISSLYKLGLSPLEVEGGEWWRVLSANFVHYGWIHLISNMLGLYFIGKFLELKIGIYRYLLTYFISGIGSKLLYAILAIKIGEINEIVVGASAAIMGLVGAICAIYFRIWQRRRCSYSAKMLFCLFLTIGIQFIFDLAIPQVSFLSHVSGLAIGFITAVFLLNEKELKL